MYKIMLDVSISPLKSSLGDFESMRYNGYEKISFKYWIITLLSIWVTCRSAYFYLLSVLGLVFCKRCISGVHVSLSFFPSSLFMQSRFNLISIFSLTFRLVISSSLEMIVVFSTHIWCLVKCACLANADFLTLSCFISAQCSLSQTSKDLLVSPM